MAGDFAPNHPGDEIGLYDGKNWYLDTVGDNQLHTKIASNMPGYPIVGDFNGDGSDDLATFDNGKNIFYFDLNRDGIADDSLAVTGPFNGYTDLPVAGDYNLDGIDDLGIWVPNHEGSPTPNISEWYFLISDHTGQQYPHNVFDQYAPTPLGNDVFAQFGDNFSLPIFGNFDPPTAASTPVTNTNKLNPLDVNNDGFVAPNDVLAVVNQINAGIKPLKAAGIALPPYTDVNGDGFVSAIDSLMIINYLNTKPGSGGEGESSASIAAQDQSASSDSVGDDLLAMLAADSTTVKQKRGII